MENLEGLMFLDAYRNKRVFLTGHTGFKGAWLAHWLIKSGAIVTGFAKDIPTTPSLFQATGLASDLVDLRGDVRDLGALERALGEAKPDIVFHLAAQPLVRRSYEDPFTTFAENTLGTAAVLEAVRRAGSVAAMVVVTTDKVYENLDGARIFRERDPLGGHDPYSASKAAAEIVFSSYCRSFFSAGTRMCSARAGNVIGGGDWAEDRLVPDCARAWAKGEAVLLRNPSSVRPWEHVLEPLGGYLLLGQRLMEQPEGVHGEAFNFGPADENGHTTLALVEEMEKHWPGKAHRLAGSASDGKKEAGILRLNCDKAAERIGWRPALSFEETVAWTSAWYRGYYEGGVDMRATTLGQIERYEKKLRGVLA